MESFRECRAWLLCMVIHCLPNYQVIISIHKDLKIPDMHYSTKIIASNLIPFDKYSLVWPLQLLSWEVCCIPSHCHSGKSYLIVSSDYNSFWTSKYHHLLYPPDLKYPFRRIWFSSLSYRNIELQICLPLKSKSSHQMISYCQYCDNKSTWLLWIHIIHWHPWPYPEKQRWLFFYFSAAF